MRTLVAFLLGLAVLVPVGTFAASAPPPETVLTVQVNAADTGKPIDRASVVINFKHGLNPIKMSKIRTNWETRTSQEGTVTVPAIPMGEVTIQIIADHFQTFGDVYQLTKPAQTITVKLERPQPQYSEDAKQK